MIFLSCVKHFLRNPIAKVPLVVFVATVGIQHSWAEGEVSLPEITIMPMSTLSFGTFSVERGVGSVVVDARSGSCTPKAGVVMLKNLCERGQFEIRGQPEAQILVELLPGDAAVGAQLKNLTLYPSGILKLGLDGKARVQVGGEFFAQSSQRSDTIDTQYMVSVNYLK